MASALRLFSVCSTTARFHRVSTLFSHSRCILYCPQTAANSNKCQQLRHIHVLSQTKSRENGQFTNTRDADVKHVTSSKINDNKAAQETQDDRDVFGTFTEEYQSSASEWNNVQRMSTRKSRKSNAIIQPKTQHEQPDRYLSQRPNSKHKKTSQLDKDLMECSFDTDSNNRKQAQQRPKDKHTKTFRSDRDKKQWSFEEEVEDMEDEQTFRNYERPQVTRRNARDTFGVIAGDEEYHQTLTTSEKLKHLDLDFDEGRTERKRNQIRTVHWYARQIERLIQRGQIYEAIEMLETRMIREDRVMPEAHHFSALIGGLGRVGYSRKAYKVYNLMKKLQVEPDGPTYTGLFNSFANTPVEHQSEALEKAKRLHVEVREKEIELNMMTYNAMVKAYGMLGEIMLAFSVVDEMESKSVPPDAQTFSCLLIACISDKDAGFKHAIEVWRRYRKTISRRRKLRFDIHLYNLLLRACRDCGVGDEKYVQELIKLGTTSQPQLPSTQNLAQVEDGNKAETLVPNTVPATFSAVSRVPNILNPDGFFGDIVGLGNLDTGVSRLGLLGGPIGILSHMRKDNVKPDVKTFTLLLDLLPSTREAEQELLQVIEQEGQKPDLDLLNLMIRRCNLRNDSDGAADILALIGKLQYQPTLMTFGCLAMGCGGFNQARQLLDDMDDLGIVPNAEIFNILAYQSRNNHMYKYMLLSRMERLGLVPEELFIRRMEESMRKGTQNLVKLDRGELEWPADKEERFRKTFNKFAAEYKKWLLRMKIAEKQHPWAAYKKPSPVEEEIVA